MHHPFTQTFSPFFTTLDASMALAMVVLGFAVYFRSRQVSRGPFLAVTLFAAGWASTLALASSGVVPTWTNTLMKGALLSGLLVAFFVTVFVRILIRHRPPSRRTMFFLALPLLFLGILLPTHLLVTGAQIAAGYEVTHGLLHPLYTLAIIGYFGSALWTLKRSASRAIGIEKNRKNLVFRALLFAIAWGVGCNLIATSWGYGGLIYVGPLGMAIFILLTGFAIVRYRLFDVIPLVRTGLIYSIVVGVFTSLLLVGVYMLGQYFSAMLGEKSIVVGVLVLAILGLLVQPVRWMAEAVVDRIFLRTRYEYTRALRDLTQIAAQTSSVAELTSSIQAGVRQTVGARTAQIYLQRNRGEVFAKVK